MKKIILLTLVLLTVWFKLYYFNENTGFKNSDGSFLFRVESAMRYHYARIAAEGREIPKVDYNAQYPEGLKVHERIKLTTEYISGLIYRFAPINMPFYLYIIYFMFIVSSISLLAVYLITSKICDKFYACIISVLFYAAAFPSYARTVVGGFVEEDFALPFIFLSFVLFFLSVENPKKKVYSFLTGLFLFIPITSWHLTQFYFTLFLMFVVFQFFFRFKENENIIIPFLYVTGFNIFGGLFVPTLKAESYLFSYNMLISYSLIIAWIINKYLKKERTAVFAVFCALVVVFAVLFALSKGVKHSSEYNHVYSLVLNKIKYMGAKPDDSKSMPFDAKVFWQAGFATPGKKNMEASFGGIIAVSIFGIMAALIKFFRRKTSIAEEGLLYFLLAFIPLYLLFERLYVFLLFFIAPFASQLINLKLKINKNINTMIICCLFIGGISFQIYKGLTYDIKNRDVEVHNDAVRRIKLNTTEHEPVLANFGVSALIFEYGERPVILHPMFEASDIREKTKECYESIFKSEEDFYKLCKKYKIKIFLYDWHFILDKSKNSVRYSINNNELPKDSAAIYFNFYPEKLKHFSLLYQNTYYRIYRVEDDGVKPSIAGNLKYFPFFNPKIFIYSDKERNINDNYAYSVMSEVWNFPKYLDRGKTLRKQGKNDLAEEAFKKVVGIDPFFPEARLNLGEFYLSIGKTKEAIEQLTAALKLDCTSLNHYYFLSQAYYISGNLDASIIVLKEALKIAPDQKDILKLLNDMEEERARK